MVKISGLAELRTSFAEGSSEIQNKAGRGAVASAASIIRREAKNIVKSKGLIKTGALLENIAIKRDKSPAGVFTYNVGVRHGSKAKRARKVVTYRGTRASVKYENDPFYFFMLEFGTSKMPAKPFLRPAFESKKADAAQRIADRLRTSIEKFKAKRR